MNKIIRQLVFISIMLAMGGAFGYFIGSLLPDTVAESVVNETSNTPFNGIIEFLSLFIQLFVIAYLVILLHELGHSFGSYLADYKPYQVIVGVTTFDFSGERWRLRWNSDWTMAGGISISLSKHNRNSRWRYLAYVIAGPLTTLLTGLLSIGVWALLPDTPLSNLFLFFGFISATIVVATLFPAPMGLLRTDGYRAIKLIWRYDDEARAWIAATDIIAHMVSGQALQTLDEELLTVVGNNPNDTFSSAYYKYMRALEIGDTEQIMSDVHEMEAIITTLPTIVSKDLRKELAFVYGWVAPDGEQFQSYYDSVSNDLKTPSSLNYRVMAAYHQMSGNVKQAQDALHEAQRLLQSERSIGYGTERIIIERLLADNLSMPI